MMRSAIGVRMEFGAWSHLGPLISRVHFEQLKVLQKHIPNSSHQVQSDIALGIALSAILTLVANDPNSEAGRKRLSYCATSHITHWHPMNLTNGLLSNFPTYRATVFFPCWAAQATSSQKE